MSSPNVHGLTNPLWTNCHELRSLESCLVLVSFHDENCHPSCQLCLGLSHQYLNPAFFLAAVCLRHLRDRLFIQQVMMKGVVSSLYEQHELQAYVRFLGKALRGIPPSSSDYIQSA